NSKLYNKRLALEIFLNNFEPFEREPIKNVMEMIEKGVDIDAEEKKEEEADEEE
ncbi:unnamed protein product, partial [marine sediment metagenome]